MQALTSRESAEQFFLEQLKTIEGITRFVCARASLRDADADDFSSFVNLRLIENDYAIIRSFEWRSSPATFLTVVIQRLLLDYRIRQWGRWHPSAEAKRLGTVAVELERAVYRDGKTPAEALAVCRAIDKTMTQERADALIARLPRRAVRTKTVSMTDVALTLRAPAELSADRLLDRANAARDASAIISDVLRSMPEDDALLVRLRFGAGMSVADISRVLKRPQFPLYGRLRQALRELRKRLESYGISARDAEELLSTPDSPLDFGLHDLNSVHASVDSEERTHDEQEDEESDD